jgi:4-amino-4-deoxy-L-arabinose transferase-like glycosyltransferase
MSQRHFLIALLCLAWIVPGLIGHDPWKSDEATAFGVVLSLLQGGSWLAPTLAGEPFIDEPPLYYLISAATAWLASPLLPLHDGARLATGVFMALTFVFTGLASRELNGKGNGAVAALLLLGAFGLVVRGHQNVTDVAPLAGIALGYYALALAPRRALAGGCLLGTALGTVFLSQGILETAMLALIAAALPLAGPAWRTRAYAGALGAALLIAAPLIAAWPLALHGQSPALLDTWVRHDLRTLLTGDDREVIYFLRVLPWYAWPAWLLCLWTLWTARRQPRRVNEPNLPHPLTAPAVALPLTGLVVSIAALSYGASARELHALPLLPALALLAAPGVATLRRGAANAWLWFSVMAATFFIIVGWFYWMGLELGVPARLHAHLHRIQPGYTPGFKTLAFAIAAGYTVAWFVLVARLRRVPHRAVVAWAAGVTVIWGMLNTLFLPWIDTGKSYRTVFVAMKQQLPARYQCVASRNLGESQRVLLHYFANVVTQRAESAVPRGNCDLLLTQGTVRDDATPFGWRKIWEGARPGDKVERYRLYRRIGGR